jgi:hypothetical protein
MGDVYLDLPHRSIDWDEVGELVTDSYGMQLGAGAREAEAVHIDPRQLRGS